MASGAYSWDNAMVEGRRRLALLEHSLDPPTLRRLDAIGVQPGWHCLDVGAGGGTVCEWLCRRVGEAGRVVGVDLDARFLRTLDCPNLEESDILPVFALDRTGWNEVSMRACEVIGQRGSHVEWARDLPYKVKSLGLIEVKAEAEFPYFHGGSELAEFWRITWGHVRDRVAAAGGDVSSWERGLAELDDPDQLFVAPMTLGVIGRKGGQRAHRRLTIRPPARPPA